MIYFICSLLIVAFGQPASIGPLSSVAAIMGYGLFFASIADRSVKARFWLGTLFYFIISCIQLRWFLSHPYFYIIGVLIGLSFLLALQFGFISLFASRKQQTSGRTLLIIPALWTIFEWSRLFLLSGFTFNPAGIALTWNTTTLQCVQIAGIFGLSFWVMLVNTLFSRALLLTNKHTIAQFTAAAALPFLVGCILFAYHEQKMALHDKESPPINALIINMQKLPKELEVQTQGRRMNPIEDAKNVWEELMQVILPFEKNDIDLIVLPEIVIPLPSRATFFSNAFVDDLFQDIEEAEFQENVHSSQHIAKKMGDFFHASVVIGLEGEAIDSKRNKVTSTNAAFLFTGNDIASYNKQILVPLGEYIPFDWIKPIAEEYGLYDSWLMGVSSVAFPYAKGVLSPSICYEETFGNIMRKNAQNATLLVNLSNDGWFPNSSLGLQHLEHARPRTCENGMPLIRSCNFGVSCAIDSLGRTVMEIPPRKGISGGIATLSSYTYATPYHRFGDYPILIVSIACLLYAALSRKKED